MKKKILRPKLPYLDIFELEFEKTIIIFESSTHRSYKNEFLTYILNFGIEPAFSKGPGSTFSEGPCPGPGPHCKLCHYSSSF